MIYYKTKEEIELLRECNQLVGEALALVGSRVRPGVTTEDLDKVADEFIRDHGARPAFKNYKGFPKSICTSVNEQVVHGIPGDRELKEGDIVSVDIGVIKHEFHGDSAYTFPVGEVSEEVKDLMEVTEQALEIGIEQAVVGNRIGDIGYAIQQFVEVDHPYKVVRELVGHGLGKSLHEEPEVPNYGKRGQGTQLKEGLVLAIEPMVNMKKKEVFMAKDNWTVITADRQPSAHYERVVAIDKDKADVLTPYEPIKEMLQKNLTQ
jgi:methionyl aminopeptidase